MRSVEDPRNAGIDESRAVALEVVRKRAARSKVLAWVLAAGVLLTGGVTLAAADVLPVLDGSPEVAAATAASVASEDGVQVAAAGLDANWNGPAIQLDYTGSKYAYADVGFVGNRVVSPGDSVTRTLKIKNAAKYKGTAKVSITPSQLIPVGSESKDLPKDVSLFWNVNGKKGQATFASLVAKGKDVVLTEVPIGAGATIPVTIGFTMDKNVTTSNSLTTDPSVLKFDVKVMVYGENPEWKRLGGKDRFETATKISREHYPNGANAVVLARYDIPADALAVTPFAVQKKAPLLLTNPKTFTKESKREMDRLNPMRVYIAGGYGAVSRQVEIEIREMGFRVTRMGGKDRFVTANIIANAGWGKTGADEVFIATGWDFPDALGASAAAGGIDRPVLLVAGDASDIRADVKKQLRALGPDRVNIAGGKGVVSAAIERQLRWEASTVKRYGGKDRYETSALIAKEWHTVGGTVYVATGADFADALTGAAVAGTKPGPVLLTRDNCLPKPVYDVMNQMIKPTMGYILGGKGVVTDRVLLKRPSCG